MLINLGGNLYRNCGTAIKIRGKEIFSARSGPNDAQLLADFDVLDGDGERIAKVAKNQAVFAAPGYTVTTTADSVAIVGDDGVEVAAVRRTGKDALQITGIFWVDGYCLDIEPHVMRIGGTAISGSHFEGFPTALEFN